MTPQAAANPAPPADENPPATMRYWLVRVAISERGDSTWARAVLRTNPGRELDATGRAVCRAEDLPDHEIGDEVATARALRALADRLLERATADITQVTGEHDVSLRHH
ncbi:dsRBD fold-containing protein [Pedococcus sp. NPDC057267]|uniref:dsRBD fold-containing protein n=1 Tax=Pedococcus sp. NPDC057267 TaxID=3346077 RepID=UPI0036380A16